MEHTPPTNELIKRLAARLSPEAREVQAEIDAITDALYTGTPEAEVEALMDRAMERVKRLPEEDQHLLQRISELKARAYGHQAEEDANMAELARAGAASIRRAAELERAEGRTVDADSMTLGEALAILERHGE